MARKLILENLMKLASGIGANPNKFMGTKTNITFLGKGPQKNPLFQRYLPGLENATEASLGSRSALIEATEDAMGFASAGKLNDIQLKILTENLSGINKILNPPPLPMATVSQFPKRGSGIASLETEGVKGATSIGPVKGRSYRYIDEQGNTRIQPSKEWSDKAKSMLPEPGPGDAAAFQGALNMQTGMSRAIARNLLLKDNRLKLSPEDLSMLREGKGEPLDLMAKYYGRSMSAYDDFLNQVDITAASPDEFAEMILKNINLTPAFAGGGLAKILEVNDQVNRYDLM